VGGCAGGGSTDEFGSEEDVSILAVSAGLEVDALVLLDAFVSVESETGRTDVDVDGASGSALAMVKDEEDSSALTLISSG
jgi:hypothetical protein